MREFIIDKVSALMDEEENVGFVGYGEYEKAYLANLMSELRSLPGVTEADWLKLQYWIQHTAHPDLLPPHVEAAEEAAEEAGEETTSTQHAAAATTATDHVLEELKTTEGIVYASETERFILMMSDREPIVRFCKATGVVEVMEGEEWVLCTLDASGATTSGGVAGTSGGSSSYSNSEINLEIKKRREIFLKQCQTHGGFNISKRTDLMASGCGRTCLQDAMLTIESSLKDTIVRDVDKAKTRKFFRDRHSGDPNERDAMAYGAEKGLNVTYRQDTSPRNLLKLTGACLIRLEYKYEKEGVLKFDTHYMAFINGMLVDNNKRKDPPVITHADMKNNATAMAPFWHYFDETTKEIKLTHVYVVTLRAPKRSAKYHVDRPAPCGGAPNFATISTGVITVTYEYKPRSRTV